MKLADAERKLKEMTPQDDIDMDDISDCEKATILQVLKRNNKVKHREERRVQQLAVRVQLSRLTDMRTLKDESELKTKTGEWHKDMLRRRCRGKSVDIPTTIYKRISTDLMSTDSRHSTSSRRWSKSLSSSSNLSPALRHSPARSKSESYGHDCRGMDMNSIKDWVDRHTAFNHNLEIEELSENEFDYRSGEESSKAGNISLNIQKQETTQQREI